MDDERRTAFEDLLLGNDADIAEQEPPLVEPARPVPGRGWLIASASCLGLGLVVLAAAAISVLAPQPQAEPAASVPVPAAEPVPTAAPQEEPDASPSRPAITDLVDDGWVRQAAERTGIPARALAAYAGAALQISEETPECGLGWNTLAGIGHVESEHGSYGGSVLGEDGVVRPAIIGIPLNGQGVDAIRDTDAGAMDGDTVWDRAVGPMQFIPTTWEEWGADGDADGVADPQDIDDAALAAGRYLCYAAGGDLTDPEHWIAAVAAYNDTIEYNNRVAEAAGHYARAGS